MSSPKKKSSRKWALQRNSVNAHRKAARKTNPNPSIRKMRSSNKKLGG